MHTSKNSQFENILFILYLKVHVYAIYTKRISSPNLLQKSFCRIIFHKFTKEMQHTNFNLEHKCTHDELMMLNIEYITNADQKSFSLLGLKQLSVNCQVKSNKSIA